MVYEHNDEIIDISLDDARDLLYFISENNLIEIDLASGDTKLIDDEINRGRELEVDSEEEMIYYIQNTSLGSTSGLYLMNTNGTGARKIETDPIFLNGLAIDPINQKIFYSTFTFNNLYSINYNGSGEVRIFDDFTTIPFPSDIAVDPATNTVFHVDLLYRDAIFSANYDGTSKKTILESDVNIPVALTYDKAIDRMFYSNGSTGFASDRTEAIYETNLAAENPMLLHGQSEAFSPRDMELDADAGHLYFVNSQQIKRSDLDGSNVVILYDDATNKIGLAIDTENDMIYWYESTDRTIHKAPIDGSGPIEDLVEQEMSISIVTDLEINLKDGKMYWVDNRNDNVSRSNLDGSDVELLYELDGPFGLVIDEEDGKLYVTSDDLIIRSNLDGSSIEELSVVGGRAGPIMLTEKTLSSLNDLVANGISAFPNPANDILTLESDADNTQWQLYDIKGRFLENGVLDLGFNKLHLSSYELGVYFIHFHKENGQRFTMKLIKKN